MNPIHSFSRVLLPAVLAFLAASSGLVAKEAFPISALKEGDAIRVVFYPDSGNFINGVYPIDPQGNIVLPIVGRSSIRNMTETNIVNFLNKSFVEQLRYPNARIEPLIRISFLGGFIHPGLFYVNPSSSFFEALRTAGGPLREDGLSLMIWERKGTVIKDNLAPLVESGHSLYGLGFESGDQVSVTTRPKKSAWDKFNQDALPLLTFMVTSVTASIAVYSTYRLLSRE